MKNSHYHLGVLNQARTRINLNFEGLLQVSNILTLRNTCIFEQ